MPQKGKAKCHKKVKQNATKRQSKIPQKGKIICVIHLFAVTLQA